jgi:hypothetical protein
MLEFPFGHGQALIPDLDGRIISEPEQSASLRRKSVAE